MMTEHTYDKIADHEDWIDGINLFRLKTREELERINEKLDHIMKVLNEQRNII